MRPLRLSLTAFGPYAGTEVVDFEALADLGLFVVSGNNGSGKTTIFDALHYSLFGTLPGRRASYIRLKSDHSDDHTQCRVSLDFAAHGQHWRVERSPQQNRPKRKGTGFTKAPTKAVLYRLDDGVPVAITNRIEEVREQCTQLVGLTGKQFERVALLPQGEFSRVLQESGTERRELLRTLFSSEVFGDATTLLNDLATQATAADRSVIERLDHRQAALSSEIGTLIETEVPTSIAEMTNVVNDFRRVTLQARRASVAELEAAASHATAVLQSGREVGERIQRRQQVTRELAQHRLGQAQHERDTARLMQARAAVPVMGQARAFRDQQLRLAAAQTATHDLNDRLTQALHATALPSAPADATDLAATAERLQTFISRLADRRGAADNVSDLDHTIARLTGNARRAANEIKTLTHQLDVAHSQHRQTTSELARLDAATDIVGCERELEQATRALDQRVQLQQLDQDQQAVVHAARSLDDNIELAEIAYQAAHRAQITSADLNRKADDAVATLAEATRRHTAAEQFAAATASLTRARSELTQAQQIADQLWDAFIAGTAGRVAQALVDDEPCPVCGSCEHPAPAIAPTTEHPASGDDVAAARAHVDDVQSHVRRHEARIESLRNIDHDIASVSLRELVAEINTAKAMALGARTAADHALEAATHGDALATQLAAAREQRAELDTELQDVNGQLNVLKGALGTTAAELVTTLEQRVVARTQALALANDAAARRAGLEAELIQLDQTLVDLGLEQIAAQSRCDSIADQLDQHRSAHEHATASLHEIDRELLPANADGTDHAHQLERRAQAARHATELIPQIATARALEHDAAEGERRAKSILGERLAQSSFDSLDAATAAFVAPDVIEQLETQVASFTTAQQRLQGQLHELADLPDVEPDLARLHDEAQQATARFADQNRAFIALATSLDRCEADLISLTTERAARQNVDHETQRLERVAALVKGDNDRNTSLENWVLAAHLRDVVELANLRLAQSTHQRFQLCVLDDGENKRGKWGLDLGVEDTVTGTQRPTAGLSGGELFQASLALALGLADAVMNQSAGVRIDALFIDEGFGSLDEISVERAIDLLDELRDRGAMVGVITHVPALLDALPRGVTVIDAPDQAGSTIRQAPQSAA